MSSHIATFIADSSEAYFCNLSTFLEFGISQHSVWQSIRESQLLQLHANVQISTRAVTHLMWKTHLPCSIPPCDMAKISKPDRAPYPDTINISWKTVFFSSAHQVRKLTIWAFLYDLVFSVLVGGNKPFPFCLTFYLRSFEVFFLCKRGNTAP